MTKYYIMLLNSLESQFTLIDSFSSFVLSYNAPNIDLDTFELKKDDMIIGYFGNPREKASMLFRIDNYFARNLKVKKVFETENGVEISSEFKKKVIEEGLIEIPYNDYEFIINEMKDNLVQHLSGDTYNNDPVCSNSGKNKIFYGIPGCGKSYYVEHVVLKDVNKNNIFRTTFYPDYTNSDFVGQIYPIVKDGNVTYEPVPGPFTKALEKAYSKPDEDVYLVIEELNRGNAAAIFGDVFQLLDRLEVAYDGRVPGDSEYPISNEFIEGYFTKKRIHFIEKKLIVPHNLTILATMNTSDQNVFPIDTAFKRRWDRERIESDWSDNNKLKGLLVPGTTITWEQFAKNVNFRITQYDDDGGIVFEDKQLGAYFATKDMLVCDGDDEKTIKEKKKRFTNNVIDYLFNDVVKFRPSKLFDNDVSYDSLYTAILNGEENYYGLTGLFNIKTNTVTDNESEE